jgi:hypothetical protein
MIYVQNYSSIKNLFGESLKSSQKKLQKKGKYVIIVYSGCAHVHRLENQILRR